MLNTVGPHKKIINYKIFLTSTLKIEKYDFFSVFTAKLYTAETNRSYNYHFIDIHVRYNFFLYSNCWRKKDSNINFVLNRSGPGDGLMSYSSSFIRPSAYRQSGGVQ